MIGPSEATLSPKPLKTFFYKENKNRNKITQNKTKPNQTKKQTKKLQENPNPHEHQRGSHGKKTEKKRHYTRREWLTSTTFVEAAILFPTDGMLCTAAAQ
jgi:hypothetical protein